MNKLSVYQKYLLIGKITQTLNDEEAAELEVLFRDNEDLDEAYKNLQKEFPGEWVKNGLQHLDNSDYWLNLETALNPPVVSINRSRRLITRFSVAALIAGVAIFGWWLVNSLDKNKNSAFVNLPEKAVIQLKLANGEIINLNEKKGRISTAFGNFDNNNNTLNYSSDRNVNGINTIYVPAAMNYSVTLNDGSKIFLNSMSQLEFPSNFLDSNREITLSGEAYLEIAKNTAQPFIVHLPGSSVTVLGTEFNVNTYDSATIKVALVSGAVNLTGGNKTISVDRGKEGIYNASGVYQQPFDAKTVLSWREGLYYYDGVGLNELSRIIERWYGIKVTIDNPLLHKKAFVGVIDKSQTLQSYLEDLYGMSKISSTIDKEGVLHFK